MITRLTRAATSRLIRLSLTGLPRGYHLTRYAMYRRLQEVLSGHPKEGRALAVSRSVRLAKVLGLTGEVVEANYPEFDLTALPHGVGEFDFVLSDQVLEHIRGNPQAAIAESHRVLRPGGLAIHTTVLMHPIHGHPHDYWRFTPECLRYLCREFGSIIEVGGWGNPTALRLMAMGLGFEEVPESPWHPFHRAATRNDPAWPIMSWIIARK